ncbi:spore cortex-lytic enzyme [Evansella clarkii]|uniref:spore cortex-lytic enzyme n=1 Tax=Evansella clarkii TaxID=79879 RepID=UPI001ADA5AAA
MGSQRFLKFKKHHICLVVSLFIYGMLLAAPQPAEAFSDQVIQKGATGDDVVELQARLQYIGFYNGDIDGVFGWSTYWATRNFQHEFGMEVTGLAGEKTKDMLERSTQYDKEYVHRMLREGRKFTYYGGMDKKIQKGPKGSGDSPQQGGQRQPQGGGRQQPPAEPEQQGGQQEAPAPQEGQGGGAEQPAPAQEQEQPAPAAPQEEETPAPAEEEPVPQDNAADIESAINVPEGFTDNDIRIMAQAVYGEARGEPYVGQVAVAAVILNRIASPTFPNTASGVIFEPRAFTAVADGQIYMEPDETARKAVLDAINGQDPSGNALYYFNPDTATSGWIWTRPQIKKIGKHIFCE